tara:strand:- start:33 stop:440 length:408 start_codon:yes stop_codon:yes gene_type:complete
LAAKSGSGLTAKMKRYLVSNNIDAKLYNIRANPFRELDTEMKNNITFTDDQFKKFIEELLTMIEEKYVNTVEDNVGEDLDYFVNQAIEVQDANNQALLLLNQRINQLEKSLIALAENVTNLASIREQKEENKTIH